MEFQYPPSLSTVTVIPFKVKLATIPLFKEFPVVAPTDEQRAFNTVFLNIIGKVIDLTTIYPTADVKPHWNKRYYYKYFYTLSHIFLNIKY